MKFEIAMAAGMSLRTLSRWMSQHQAQLSTLGVRPSQRLLPPRAVRFVCNELGIDELDFAQAS